MASGSDGSIHVSTKINTEPVKKGLSALKGEAIESAKAIKKGFSDVGQGFKVIGQNAMDSAKNMLSGYRESCEELDRQSIALDRLKNQLDMIMNGEATPTSVKAMETELNRAEREVTRLKKEMEELVEADRWNEAQFAGKEPSEISNYDEAQAQMAQVKARAEEVTAAFIAAEDKAGTLRNKVEALRLDPSTTAEVKDLTNRIALMQQEMDSTENKTISLKDRLISMAREGVSHFGKLGKANSSLKSGFDKVGSKIDKLKNRVTRLIGAAFVFNVMRRGLRQLSDTLSGCLKSNSQFAKSLNQIKANLWTAFTPIYNAILPAINALMSALSTLTGTIANFIAGIFGKTANQAKANAAALYGQAEAYNATGKAAEEAQGKLASFDNLEVNDANKNSDSSGGSSGSDPVDFSGSVNQSSWLLELLEKIKKVLGELFNPFKVAWDNVGAIVIDSAVNAFWNILVLADIGRTFLDVWNSDLGVSICEHLYMILANIFTMVGNIADSVKLVWSRNDNGKKLLNSFLNMIDKISGVVETISRTLAEFALSESFQAGVEIIMNLLSNIFEIIGWITEAFGNAWDEHGLNVLTGIQNILNPILQFINDIAESLKLWVMSDGFQQTLSIVMDMLGSILGWIGEIAQWIVEMYEQYLKPIIEEKLIPLINTIIAIIGAIWEVAKPVIDWIVDALKTVLEPAISFLCGVIGGIIDVVQWVADLVLSIVNGDIAGAFGKFGELAQGCWDFICGIFEGVANWFNEHLIQPVKDFFASMWDGIKEGASKAWEGIKNVFGAVTGWFKEVFSKAWEGVKNVFSTGGKIFSGIKEGIENVFKTVVNGIIDGINKVVAIPFNTINGFLNTIRAIDILGFKPFESLWGYNPLSVPQIPKLATGGVAYAPMVAQIGEYPGARSNPEIVTPENLMRQIIREESEGSKEVVIENLTLVTQIGEDVLSRQVIKGVRLEEQRLGKPLFVS